MNPSPINCSMPSPPPFAQRLVCASKRNGFPRKWASLVSPLQGGALLPACSCASGDHLAWRERTKSLCLCEGPNDRRAVRWPRHGDPPVRRDGEVRAYVSSFELLPPTVSSEVALSACLNRPSSLLLRSLTNSTSISGFAGKSSEINSPSSRTRSALC